MRTHNLYVIPRSQAECNQLQSFVHSQKRKPLYGHKAPFRIGKVAWFWSSVHEYTPDYQGQSLCAGEQVTANELALRYNTL